MPPRRRETSVEARCSPRKRARLPADESPRGGDRGGSQRKGRTPRPSSPGPDRVAAATLGGKRAASRPSSTRADEPRALLAQPAASAPAVTHAGVDAPMEVGPPSPRRALALAFKLNTRPSDAEISALAAFLAMSTEAVSGWFERRRQLEVWARDIAHELLSNTQQGL